MHTPLKPTERHPRQEWRCRIGQLPMTCRDLVDSLEPYLAGDLTSDARAQLEAHLRACGACADYADSYLTTIKLAKAAFADATPDDLPEELVHAILEARRKLPH